MSARRSSQNSVQLFPFLAVLMCALGALILLLLVVTSRMRDQVRAERRQQLETAAVAELAAREPDLLPARDRWQPRALPPEVKLQPVPEPAAAVETEPLRSQWLRTVTELEAKAAAERDAAQAARAAAESAEHKLSQATTKLAGLQRNAAIQAQRLESSESDRQRDIERLEALQETVARESSAVEQLREQRKAASSQYKVLAYDGRTGTVRRPIYIECTETGLTFASEQITLTPEQLDGFAAVHNPLRAGADALIDYWSVQALKNPGAESVGPPYILLIVRPKGTIGYYVARRMLESIGQQFGYELVSEDLQLQWPPTDPEAVAACRAAIEAAMRDRDRFVVRGYAPPGSLAPLSVSDGSGTFALDEVEQLRGNGRKVNVGGREFERSPTPAGGGGLSIVGPGGRGRTSAPTEDGRTSGVAPKVGQPPATSAAAEPGTDPPRRSAATAQRGAPGSPQTAAPPEAAGRSGTPSPDEVAADAAAGFSSAAGKAGRSAAAESTSRSGNGHDAQPSPLPSLDAMQALAQRRTAPRNPAEVLRDPGSQIGLERKVKIRVEAQRIIVEAGSPIDVTPDMSREALQAEFALALQANFEAWGRPPRSFYWLPQIRFTVVSGGHQNLKRLIDLTNEWQMPSNIEYAPE